jgi:hypothetical protein
MLKGIFGQNFSYTRQQKSKFRQKNPSIFQN